MLKGNKEINQARSDCMYTIILYVSPFGLLLWLSMWNASRSCIRMAGIHFLQLQFPNISWLDKVIDIKLALRNYYWYRSAGVKGQPSSSCSFMLLMLLDRLLLDFKVGVFLSFSLPLTLAFRRLHAPLMFSYLVFWLTFLYSYIYN